MEYTARGIPVNTGTKHADVTMRAVNMKFSSVRMYVAYKTLSDKYHHLAIIVVTPSGPEMGGACSTHSKNDKSIQNVNWKS